MCKHVVVIVHGAGFVPFHITRHTGAGNSSEAGRACISGFTTAASVTVGAAAGPVAGVAAGAALKGGGAALNDEMKKK